MEYVEESFEYMLHHDLIEGDRIKHFGIDDCSLEDIQPALISWMKQEGERLRQREHWSIIPCNKRFGGGHFVLAYDTLFRYQQYDYRLRLDDWCVYDYCCCEIDREECIDCESDDDSDDDDEPFVHFELVREIKQESVKEPQLVIQKDPEVLAEEFRTIPCEPVLEWDVEL
jgi:hypothetical protein